MFGRYCLGIDQIPFLRLTTYVSHGKCNKNSTQQQKINCWLNKIVSLHKGQKIGISLKESDRSASSTK